MSIPLDEPPRSEKNETTENLALALPGALGPASPGPEGLALVLSREEALALASDIWQGVPHARIEAQAEAEAAKQRETLDGLAKMARSHLEQRLARLTPTLSRLAEAKPWEQDYILGAIASTQARMAREEREEVAPRKARIEEDKAGRVASETVQAVSEALGPVGYEPVRALYYHLRAEVARLKLQGGGPQGLPELEGQLKAIEARFDEWLLTLLWEREEAGRDRPRPPRRCQAHYGLLKEEDRFEITWTDVMENGGSDWADQVVGHEPVVFCDDTCKKKFEQWKASGLSAAYSRWCQWCNLLFAHLSPFRRCCSAACAEWSVEDLALYPPGSDDLTVILPPPVDRGDPLVVAQVRFAKKLAERAAGIEDTLERGRGGHGGRRPGAGRPRKQLLGG